MASIVIRRAPKPARLRWQRRKSRAVLTPATGTIFDNFNRADGPLGSNWLTSLDLAGPAPVVSSNQCRGSDTLCPAYWNPAVNSFSNDQHAQATYVTATSFDHAGVVVRHDTSGHSNFYLFFANGSNLSIYKCTAGSYLQIGTGTNSGFANGDVLRLEVVGSTLTAKVNGTTFITVTDSSFTSGQPGILANHSTEFMDDWSAGPSIITAGTQTLTPNLVAGDDAVFAPALSLFLLPALATDADSFFVPVVAATATLLPALVTDADTFAAPTVSATATVLPAPVTDADTIQVPALTPGAVTLLPATVSDTDVIFAASFGGASTLAPALVVDTDTIFAPAAFQAQSLLAQLVLDADTVLAPSLTVGPVALAPALVIDPDVISSPSFVSGALEPDLIADDDAIYASALSEFLQLRPGLLRDIDIFYPASLVGGLPVIKHALTGSVRRPALTGNLGSRRVLTGTLKRVG
jgi:hypothetical protein